MLFTLRGGKILVTGRFSITFACLVGVDSTDLRLGSSVNEILIDAWLALSAGDVLERDFG
jgi:hypothetical protein